MGVKLQVLRRANEGEKVHIFCYAKIGLCFIITKREHSIE